MPFQIIRNDLTKMQVDAIVNTTNPDPSVGYGVDMGIHQAAGPDLLLARKALGFLPVGGAGITNGYDLPAKHVIHAVCPVWQGGEQGEIKLLRQAYTRSLEIALEARCRSVAFPLMSAGNHGFPKTIALQTAVESVSAFLMDHEMMVYLVVFSREAVAISEKLLGSVESYIDEHYIAQKKLEEYGYADKRMARAAEIEPTLRHQRKMRNRRAMESTAPMEMEFRECAPPPMEAAPIAIEDLHRLLQYTDEGFSATLLKFIDRSGKKDSEVYKRANIDRKLFSKIRSNPNYQPSKPTVLAFAIALELDLEETEMLLSRAGLALSHANKQDIVVEFFIKSKNYDIFELNSVLFALDLTTLGNVVM